MRKLEVEIPKEKTDEEKAEDEKWKSPQYKECPKEFMKKRKPNFAVEKLTKGQIRVAKTRKF